MASGLDLNHLEAARMYLFGDVQFLDLLLLLMLIDVATGLIKAYKKEVLWSRRSLFGFARKILILFVIVIANIIDQLLGLDGVVVVATMFFYVGNEGLSIVENLTRMGIPLPPIITDKLKVVEEESKPPEKSVKTEIEKELLGKDVRKETEKDNEL